MAIRIHNPRDADNNTSGKSAGDIILDPIDPASLISGGIVSEIPDVNGGTNTTPLGPAIPSSVDSPTLASPGPSEGERSISVPATTSATISDTQTASPIAGTFSSSIVPSSSSQPLSSSASIAPPIPTTSSSPSSSRTPTTSSSISPASTSKSPSSSRQSSASRNSSSRLSLSLSTSFPPSSTFKTSTKTSQSTSSTSTPALGNSSTPESSPAPTQSPQNHRNIAAIAAPVAVGVFLLAILIMIFCCWRRSRSFGGSNHRRGQSSDSDMSSVVPYNQGGTYEPKSTNPRSPEPFMLSARQVPTSPQRPRSGSRASSKEISNHDEIQSISPEPTYAPGTLPGLSEHSTPVSPLGQTLAPPPYRQSQRTESPSAQSSQSAEPIEPLDIIRSSKRDGWLRRSADVSGLGSKRQGSVDREDSERPLSSPFSDMTAESDRKDPFVQPQVQMQMATGSLRRDFSRSKSPWPLPPSGIPQRGSSVAGPSSPRPAGGVKLVSNNNSSTYRNSGQSPFDDTNTNTGPLNTPSSSPYTHSDASEGQHRWSTMLQVPQRKLFNEDGISEISVESGTGERRGGSRLHHRETDEVSIVSSLNDKDREEGSGGSGEVLEKEKKTSDKSVTALPGFRE